MSVFPPVFCRQCLRSSHYGGLVKDVTALLPRSISSVFFSTRIQRPYLGSNDRQTHFPSGNSVLGDTSWKKNFLRSGDLDGLPVSLTRTFSSSAVSSRAVRLSVGHFSSAPGNKDSKPTQSDVLRDSSREKSSEDLDRLVFDPKSPDADKYYEKLAGIVPTAQEIEKQLVAAIPGASLWQRFKDMYKKYWYVVLPVHGVLCVGWYGIFYLLALRGFDILPVLEKIGISESLLNPLRKSGAGYFASAFAMYKVASPLRYSVTLAVTTVAIDRLKRLGYIKPIPSTAEMRQFVHEKRLQIQSKRKARKLNIKKDTLRRRLAQLFRRPVSAFGKGNGKGKSIE